MENISDIGTDILTILQKQQQKTINQLHNKPFKKKSRASVTWGSVVIQKLHLKACVSFSFNII